MYIHEHQEWPRFTWQANRLAGLLGEVNRRQGRLLGRMESLGFALQQEALLTTITQDVVKSSQIEGERLDIEQVRSSVARHLGLQVAGLVPSSRQVDGVVAMLLDATQQYEQPLTEERLFGWHALLFPTGYSGMHRIRVGAWRQDESGPMQVVSGALGKEEVHFQAPAAKRLPAEMSQFLTWFNQPPDDLRLDPVLKAALAHLYFVTIHPLEDGNGRMARAIADLQLARVDRTEKRFYSMSFQIERHRRDYYDILEQTQKGDLDVTAWLSWFLTCLSQAIAASNDLLSTILNKADFWRHHAADTLNERQRKMIEKLWGDFIGKLNSSKWAKMAGCSKETAVRDINDLLEKGMLRKEEAGGRSTSYMLNWPPVPPRSR
jgi:Fic family protein